MFQQLPPQNFTATKRSHNQQPLQTKIPTILIDFTAMTLCDLIKTRKTTIQRSLPEFVFFVQKITHQASMNVRTLLVALIYLYRAKSNLPKRAIGSDDTQHRMFLGAILTASKFLQEDTTTFINRRIYEICGGLFSLDDLRQIEIAFLKLVQYQCWVDDITLNEFVESHRSDFSL